MALTLTLILATLFAAAALISALVPARAAVKAGCATNVLQLHTISVLGIYPSLALLSWLATWRSTLGSPLWRWPWMQGVAALAVLQAVSIAWSPAPMVGVRHLIYLLPLPLAAHALYTLAREQPATADKCLRLLLFGSALGAVLVIGFRVLPSVELAFLRRSVAGLFVSPNTLAALFQEGRNNVLDPAKAGGLFVNANIASAYLGMCAVAAWYIGRASGSAALRAVALLDWTAVLFTGSKAGLLCAVAVPAGLALMSAIRRRQANPVTLFAATVGIALAAVSLMLPFSRELLDDYRYDTFATLGARGEIWRYALDMIAQSPLTGLGFGGWEQRFQVYAAMAGMTTAVPAHNSLFILWLQSGLPGLAAGIALVAAVYAAVARGLSSADYQSRQFAMAASGAFSWYFIQGLGENFGLTGEVHMTPLIGALLGTLCARHDAVTRTHERESVRGPATPSAVLAV